MWVWLVSGWTRYYHECRAAQRGGSVKHSVSWRFDCAVTLMLKRSTLKDGATRVIWDLEGKQPANACGRFFNFPENGSSGATRS